MYQPTTVEPDLAFKRHILGLDADHLTACYQCGTCSVVCPVSTDDDPFPRKEMIWTQWGLKDRVMNDAAIWLCHQCHMCTTYCPRDAQPANVMAALREYSIGYHAFPAFLGRWVGAPRFLPLLFGLPVALLLIVLALEGHLTSLPEGEIIYRAFIPHVYIETIYLIAVCFALVAGTVGALRYWRGMRAGEAAAGVASPGAGVWRVLADILAHTSFTKCVKERVGERKTYKAHMPHGHRAVFFGFGGLILTTLSVYIGIVAFDYYPPLPQLNPVKLLGNVSGIAVLGATLLFIVRRLVDKEMAGKTTYTDWLFVLVLLAVVVTGFMTQITRLADAPWIAYPTYFTHLVLIFFLLAYSPYSKFAHVYYRPVAMLFARYREAMRRASNGGPREGEVSGGELSAPFSPR